jgi:hypothetical protein
MKRRSALAWAGASAALSTLGACASGPPSKPSATSALALPASLIDGPAPSGGRLWRADTAQSVLRIVAFRGGKAPQLGHHHILQAGRFEGALWLPDKGLAGAQGELRVPLAELVVDDPAWRAAAGGEFNEKPVDEAARAGTLRNLLSPQGLNAGAHPAVRLQLLQLTGAAPWWVADVALTLAGVARSYTLGLRVTATAERLRLQGELALRQTVHGLQPYSVLGGLLAMQDEVLLSLDLALH